MTTTRGSAARPGAAHRLAALAGDVLGGPLPVRLRAWDDSETGMPATTHGWHEGLERP